MAHQNARWRHYRSLRTMGVVVSVGRKVGEKRTLRRVSTATANMSQQQQIEDKDSDAIIIPSRKKQLEHKDSMSHPYNASFASLSYVSMFHGMLKKQRREVESHRGLVEFQRIVSSPYTSALNYITAISKEAIRRCNCELASVFFSDEVRQEMWCVGSQDLESFSVKFGVGIVGLVASTGKLVNLEDAESNPQFFNKVDKDSGFRTKSILALPIFHPKNEKLTIGVLECINKIGDDAFNQKDILSCKKLVLFLGESFYKQRFVAIQSRSECDVEAASMVAQYNDKGNHESTKQGMSTMKKDGSAADMQTLIGAFAWPAMRADFPETFCSTNFDVLSFEEEHLKAFVYLIFEDTGCVDKFRVDEVTMEKFADAMMNSYRQNPFHNWYHGFGVMHYCYLQLQKTNAVQYLTHLEVFALLIAALGHDADHPGLTNAYIVETEDPIALRYNDVSVLENHHATQTCNLLRDPATDVSSNLSKQDKRLLRKTIINSILATDMSHHSTLCKEIMGRTQQQCMPFGRQVVTDRALLLKMIIHVSDLSIQTFPWKIASKWEQRISTEFANQASKERERGIPVLPFMENLDNFQRRGKLQCDFIEYCLFPLWDPYTQMFFELRPQYDTLKANHSKYAARAEDAYEAIESANVVEVTKSSKIQPRKNKPVEPKRQKLTSYNGHGVYVTHQARGAGQKRGSPYTLRKFGTMPHENKRLARIDTPLPKKYLLPTEQEEHEDLANLGLETHFSLSESDEDENQTFYGLPVLTLPSNSVTKN